MATRRRGAGRRCNAMSCYDGVDPLEEGRERTYMMSAGLTECVEVFGLEVEVCPVR
jgi:hypothetical protein